MIDPLKNDFFHDFLVFLKYLEQKPIQRTITGNISRADIFALQPKFKQQTVFKEFKKYDWKIRTEREVEFLTQIKFIAEVMYLTYNRRGKLLISGNGRAFLHRIDQITQYWNMVGYFWDKVNWEYFIPGPEINGIGVVGILQKNRNIIWNTLLENGIAWIDFKVFCQTIKTFFKLENYYQLLGDFSFCLDIEYGLLRKNLARLGCIIFEAEKDKNKLGRVLRFKPTELGMIALGKALGPFL